jgi:hypothetical protein
MSETLTKVDSAVQGLGTSPPKEHVKGHRRASSSAAGVFNINDLGKATQMFGCFRCIKRHKHSTMQTKSDKQPETQGVELQIAPETQKLGW